MQHTVAIVGFPRGAFLMDTQGRLIGFLELMVGNILN
jgi:hypothetical protein